MKARQRAVFLDRDGVLNHTIVKNGNPFPPRNSREFKILPGAARACKTLKEAGFRLFVITNQPDVARGTQRRKTVEAMNETLEKKISVDHVFVCYHDDKDRCVCRKPKPGFLIQAAKRWRLSLPKSFMVGDRSKDIEAGKRAGCKTVLIDSGHKEAVRLRPDFRAGSLAEAVPFLLNA